MSCPEATSLKKIDGKDFCCIDDYDGEDACMPLKDRIRVAVETVNERARRPDSREGYGVPRLRAGRLPSPKDWSRPAYAIARIEPARDRLRWERSLGPLAPCGSVPSLMVCLVPCGSAPPLKVCLVCSLVWSRADAARDPRGDAIN